jgi:hypothetical protein
MCRLIALLLISAALAGLSGCASSRVDILGSLFDMSKRSDIDRLRDEGYGYGNNKSRPSDSSEVDGY